MKYMHKFSTICTICKLIRKMEYMPNMVNMLQDGQARMRTGAPTLFTLFTHTDSTLIARALEGEREWFEWVSERDKIPSRVLESPSVCCSILSLQGSCLAARDKLG